MTPRVDHLVRLYRRQLRRSKARTLFSLSLGLACCTAKELDAYYRAVAAERASRRSPEPQALPFEVSA